MTILSRVLFPCPPASYTAECFPGELLWVPRSLNPQTAQPEDCIPLCLLQCSGATRLIVYFHSNFEDIGRCYRFCAGVRERLKVNVLIVEYPAYGICPGDQCDELSALECARAALRFVREVLRCPQGSIVLMGRSIGTGLASQLATEHRYGGLVLICPFLSVKELASNYIGLAASFIAETFPNKANVSQVKFPCLFVHGQSDRMIPVQHSQELFAACTAKKSLVSPEQMDHNANLLEDEGFFLEPMRTFLKDVRAADFQLNVPSWTFDKQMCPQYATPHEVPVAASRLACWANRGACSVCGVCSGGACSESCNNSCQRDGTGSVPKPFVVEQKPMLEATIARVVENNFLFPEIEAKRTAKQKLRPMVLASGESTEEEKVISL